MASLIGKVEILSSKKDWIIFLSFFAVVLSISLFIEYKNYKYIKIDGFYYANSIVLNQYEKLDKRKRTYTVLKLKSDNFTFYTTTYKKLPNLICIFFNKLFTLLLLTSKASS